MGALLHGWQHGASSQGRRPHPWLHCHQCSEHPRALGPLLRRRGGASVVCRAFEGDLAQRDSDGCFRIVGRVKDLIVSAGENIYPSEVESVLSGHPAVAEVCVIGVPDPKWGRLLAPSSCFGRARRSVRRASWPTATGGSLGTRLLGRLGLSTRCRSGGPWLHGMGLCRGSSWGGR